MQYFKDTKTGLANNKIVISPNYRVLIQGQNNMNIRVNDASKNKKRACKITSACHT